MKAFISLSLLALASVSAIAQEPTDTIESHELNEVVVQAELQSMGHNKASYIPTKQQRNAAINGTALLQTLAIPQLQVNTLTGSVTTNAGNAVAFFIDGVPASASDIADMNTRDVKRVEVLDHPTDPKFRNAEHVVNYIMQRYEWGGYTKLSYTEMFLSCISSQSTLNSKFVYKKLTFDARASYQYTNSSHQGTEGIQRFTLPTYPSLPDGTITRTSVLDGAKYIANRPNASFRAMYRGAKTQFSSMLEYSFFGDMTNRSHGSLSYTPNLFDAQTWDIETPAHKNQVKWSNDLFQQLGRGWSLSADFNLAYAHNNQTQIRQEGGMDLTNLLARETLLLTESEIQASKTFNDSHSISLETGMFTYRSDIDYRGSVSTNHTTSQILVYPGATYSFSYGDLFSMRASANASIYHSSTAGIKENKVYPTINFSTSWTPKERHQLDLGIYYTINTPDGAQTNNVPVQVNPLLWSQGNPYLKSYHSLVSQLSYSWMPSQKFSLSPTVAWIYKPKYFADIYSLNEDGRSIIQHPENCGNYHNVWGAVNFSAYLLNRKLILQLRPAISYHKFSGMYDISKFSPLFTAYAAYYIGQFNIAANYTSSHHFYNQANPVYTKERSTFWLMAGWGNSQWTAQVFVINPFRYHWRGKDTSLVTPDYSYSNTAITVNDHCRVQLQIAYTFGYGKKVRRGNELNGSSEANSSIR